MRKKKKVESKNMKENSLAAAPFCLAIRGSSEASRFCCTEDESFDEASHIEKLLRDPKVARDLTSGESEA